jgi:hypothetical protein
VSSKIRDLNRFQFAQHYTYGGSIGEWCKATVPVHTFKAIA